MDKDVPCAYCDTSVYGKAFVLCETCEVPVHRDCWSENAACPAYACGNTVALDPAEALFRRKSAATTLPAITEPAPPGAFTTMLNAAARTVTAVASAATAALTPKPPPVPSISARARRAEIKRIEGRLYEMQLRRWKRTTVTLAFVLMLPLVLRFIARPLLFPWLIALIAYSSWPGHKESSRKQERALRERLEQLETTEPDS